MLTLHGLGQAAHYVVAHLAEPSAPSVLKSPCARSAGDSVRCRRLRGLLRTDLCAGWLRCRFLRLLPSRLRPRRARPRGALRIQHGAERRSVPQQRGWDRPRPELCTDEQAAGAVGATPSLRRPDEWARDSVRQNLTAPFRTQPPFPAQYTVTAPRPASIRGTVSADPADPSFCLLALERSRLLVRGDLRCT